MHTYFKFINFVLLFTFWCVLSIYSYGQRDSEKWKAQIAFGFNYPDIDGFVTGFEAKPINFPTINLGIQHMFKPNLGVKLDYGFNRFSNADNSPEFKTNYSRINAQIVYDVSKDLRFLPNSIDLIAHGGPGMSFIKPLGNYSDNGHSFFNSMVGVEIHYRVAEFVTIYPDVFYVIAFAEDKTYNPIFEGYGTFNNNLFGVTLGVAVSLSGCQYCD